MYLLASCCELKRTPLIHCGPHHGWAPSWRCSKMAAPQLSARLELLNLTLTLLPTLIFESAFVMDVHTFKKTIGQVLILAGPGLLISAFLTSLMARYVFPYNWSWVVALLFGILLSATDPVAVVALLKELGETSSAYSLLIDFA